MMHTIAFDIQKVYSEMAPRCCHPTLAVPASVSANVSYYILNGIEIKNSPNDRIHIPSLPPHSFQYEMSLDSLLGERGVICRRGV